MVMVKGATLNVLVVDRTVLLLLPPRRHDGDLKMHQTRLLMRDDGDDLYLHDDDLDYEMQMVQLRMQLPPLQLHLSVEMISMMAQFLLSPQLPLTSPKHKTNLFIPRKLRPLDCTG